MSLTSDCHGIAPKVRFGQTQPCATGRGIDGSAPKPVSPASMNGRRAFTPELPYSDPIMLGSPYSAANSNSSAERLAVATMPTSAVRDHDLPEMCATLKVAVGFLCLPEREGPVDHGAQTMHLDSAVHRLEIGAASNTDRSERDTTAGEQ